MPEVQVELVGRGVPLSGAQELGEGTASFQYGSGRPPPKGVGSQPSSSRPFSSFGEVTQLGKHSFSRPALEESSSHWYPLADRRPKLAYRAEELRDMQLQGVGGVVFAYTSSCHAGACSHVLAFVELDDELSALQADDSSPGQPLFGF